MELIDLDSLQLTNKSFVSKAGRHTHSDLIYKAHLQRRTGDVYFVIEHFSSPQDDIPLRQQEYDVALFLQHYKEGNKKLPFVINICVYSGDKPYSGPVISLEMFEHPDLIKRYWLEGNHLADLYGDPEEKIKKDEGAAWAELLLKRESGKERDFCQLLERHKHLIRKKKVPYAEEAILYILDSDDRGKTLEKLKEVTQPQYRNLVMSIAEKLTRKGMGKRMRTRTLDIARSMLTKGYLTHEVLELTGLSEVPILGIEAER